MLCSLINHSYTNEIQTVTQIFFPNTRFTFSSLPEAPSDQTGYAVLSRLEEADAIGEVYHHGERIVLYTQPLANSWHFSERRSLMLALFHALKQVFIMETPWGALTGIRPSKLVRGWLTEGQTDAQIMDILTQGMLCRTDKARLAVTVAHAEERLIQKINKASGEHTPLGLYIGIPYCPSRCLYCSFSLCGKPVKEETQALYLKALTKDCEQTAQAAKEMNGVFTSVYIGGGTPTVFPEALFEQLLDMLERCFGALIQQAEYTVEAGRPDSLTAEKLHSMKSHGVTRVAVNPQTLNDRTLDRIGRKHTAADFFRAFDMARTAGFEQINTDVIAGLPGETPEDMQRTMMGLASLSPENITVHTLAVKRSSRLNEALPDYVLPAAPDTEAMLQISSAVCAGMGLEPYYLYRQKNAVGLFENVGYSRPSCECLYNIGMMAETQTILAAGAGAVSKYVNGTRIERGFNVKNSDIYIKNILTTS